jgi:hypothetical protein
MLLYVYHSSLHVGIRMAGLRSVERRDDYYEHDDTNTKILFHDLLHEIAC